MDVDEEIRSKFRPLALLDTSTWTFIGGFCGYVGLGARKLVFRFYEQQRGRLISAFVIRFLESIISKLGTREISLF